MIAKTFVWKKDTMVLRKMDAAKIPSYALQCLTGKVDNNNDNYEELMMMGAVGLISKLRNSI